MDYLCGQWINYLWDQLLTLSQADLLSMIIIKLIARLITKLIIA